MIATGTNGRHPTDNILIRIFVKEYHCICCYATFIEACSWGPTDYDLAMVVQVMANSRVGGKPSPEPMMILSCYMSSLGLNEWVLIICHFDFYQGAKLVVEKWHTCRWLFFVMILIRSTLCHSSLMVPWSKVKMMQLSIKCINSLRPSDAYVRQ